MARHTVYAVASGKGGVGKTTTVVNVGTALAGAGHQVAIVDVDLGMANLAGFVSLSPEDVTLHDVLAGDATVQESTYKLTDGLFAVPSAADLSKYPEASMDGLSVVVDTLREAFDYVFLDVGAGVSQETVVPLGLADRVVVVTTPNPASVRDAEKTLGLVDRAGGTVGGVVVTRVRPGEGVDPGEIGERLGHDVLGVVPEDGDVRASVRAGRPLVVAAPDSTAAGAYRSIAKRIHDGDGGDGEDAGSSGATRALGGGGDREVAGADHDEVARALEETDADEEV